MGKLIVAVVIIGMIGFFGTRFMKSDDSGVAPQDTEKDAGTLEETSERIAETIVKTVRTVATYTSPAGEERIGFVLGVDTEGVIVDAQVEEMTEHEMSKKKQEAFGAAFPSAVVGKKLSDLSDLDDVGESPLTTEAFNESLEALKSQL